MTLDNKQPASYNWNLYNGIGFIVFGGLAVLLHFSTFADSLPAFKWLFLAIGTVLVLAGIAFLVRSKK